MSDVLSLEQVPREKRFSFYQSMVEEFYVPLEITCETPESFDHWRIGNRLGQADVGTSLLTQIQVSRTSSHVDRSEDDRLKVILPLSGAIAVSQDKNNTLVTPGQFYVTDPLRPSREKVTDDLTFIYLLLPRDVLAGQVKNFERITATAFGCDLPYATLATDFARGLIDVSNSLGDATTAHAGSVVSELFAMALWERQGAIQTHSTIHRSAQYEKAKAFIDRHFTDADLRLDTVADALRVSPRYLGELLAEGGINYRQYLLDRRLTMAARELRDARIAHTTVAEIAYRCGFCSTAHFSRTFKEKFEVSAREYRLFQE
jgi:AraC-like DNA-binding protein